MTPAERLDLMVELTETVRELARAGIRMRHQDYTPEQVDLALYRHIYGAEIADKAWPESRGLGT